MAGIKVGMKVSGHTCPIARESARTDTDVTEVNKTSFQQGDTVIEEAVFDGAIECSDDAFDELFSTEARTVYQYRRPPDADCVCPRIEDSLEHPISRARITDGSLYFTVHVDDIENLQSMIGTLENEFDNVTVCKIENEDILQTADTMTFDRERLTSRQRDVYRAAYEAGYFQHNGGANASEIADDLGIAIPTFSEHMSNVQTKLADAFFDDDV